MGDVSLKLALLTLLGALATGGFFTALWRSLFAHRLRKAGEAERLVRLNAAFREEIRKDNNELRARMDKVVDAICGLTDMLDELFPKITGLTDAERLTLRHSINLAKRAT